MLRWYLTDSLPGDSGECRETGQKRKGGGDHSGGSLLAFLMKALGHCHFGKGGSDLELSTDRAVPGAQGSRRRAECILQEGVGRAGSRGGHVTVVTGQSCEQVPG